MTGTSTEATLAMDRTPPTMTKNTSSARSRPTTFLVTE